MNADFISAIQELGKEKGIDPELLFQAVDDALVAAYKKNTGTNQNVRVDMNKETGEIVLSTLSVEDINGLSGAYLTFYLDDFPIFESIPVIPKSSSIIHNDLVLAIDGAKLYLLDGYPSLDVLGSNKSEAERLRKENFNKRNTSWNKFIDYLQEVGKIME